MKILPSSLSKLVFLTMCFAAFGFFTPNFSIEYEMQEALQYGAIVQEKESNIFVRILWAFLFLLSFISFYVQRVKKYVFNLYLFIPLITFMLFSLISSTWSEVPARSIIQILKHFLIFGTLYFCLSVLTWKEVFNLMYAPVLLVIAIGVLSLPFDFSWSEIGFKSIYGHKNTAGMIYSICLIYIACKCYFKRAVFDVFLCVILVFLMILAQSKTSIAFSIVSLILANVAYSRSYNIKSVDVLGYSLFMALSTVFVYFNYLLIEADFSFTGRTTLWSFLEQDIYDNLIFGYGFSSYWDLGETGSYYLYGDLFDEFIRNLNQAHNSYIDISLGMGLIGFVLFQFFLLTYYLIIFFKDRSNSDAQLKFFVYSIFIFSIFHSFMETTMMRGENVVWVFFMLGFFCITRKENG